MLLAKSLGQLADAHAAALLRAMSVDSMLDLQACIVVNMG